MYVDVCEMCDFYCSSIATFLNWSQIGRIGTDNLIIFYLYKLINQLLRYEYICMWLKC